ncbi:MAG TPA: PAS-domain containing protein [Rhodoferax sp.]|nr:PAS-domain containing protein [Rhodoferax sp.]
MESINCPGSNESRQLEIIGQTGCIGYWEYDLPTRSVLLPEASRRLLARITKGPVEAGRSFIDSLSASDRARAQAALDQAAAAQGAFQIELQLICSDGQSAGISVRGAPVTMDAGCTCLAGTFQGICGERPGEAEHGKAHAQLQALLDVLPQGVSVIDQNLRLILWNRRLHEILGFPQQMVFKNARFEDFIRFNALRGEYGPGDPETQVRDIVARASQFVPHQFERQLKDGRSLRVEGFPFKFAGEISGFVTTYTDITDQRRTEEQLTRQRDVMRTVIDNFPGGISLCDADLRFTAYNDQFRAMLDFPPELFEKGWADFEELIRFNARRGEYGPGDEEEQVRAAVNRARNFEAHRIERLRPNGTWLDIRGTPIPSGGFVTSYIDITDIKQAAEYEQFYRQTLELLVNGDPLPSILLAIVRGIEQIHPAMLCSIVLLDRDGKRLGQVIAPSLPDGFNAAMQGVAIGAGVGSCGTAAFTGARVIVEDIATHPYWEGYRALALQHRLGACWSQPIKSTSGQVMGTFSIYHHQPHTPAPADIALIEQSAQLASIAIERSLVAEKIRDSEAHFRLLTEEVADVVWKADHKLFITYISPADQRLRGYPASEVLGHHVFEMFTDEGIAAVKKIMSQRRQPEPGGRQDGFVTFEAQHRCKDGRLLWGEVQAKPERDAQGVITGYHGITRETTRRKQLEDQVRQLAFFDPLTKLPNRRLLNDRLTQSIAVSQRKDCHCALMVLDLDNFKPLNDAHGHLVGDLLLVEVAERLRGCVREIDTVARFGGDEFVVLLSDLSASRAEATAQAGVVAEKVRHSLCAPYLLLVHHPTQETETVAHRSSASIGVVVYLGREVRPEDILKWADAAMYQAKEAGRNAIRLHDAPARL